MSFELDPKLREDTFPAGFLPLCRVLLMNEARYPWCILVPARSGVSEVFDLTEVEQAEFWREVSVFAHELSTEVQAHKMNVATLGNVVPQLHLHVIARFREDDAWPKPVWGVHEPVHYGETERQEMLEKIERVVRNTERRLG